MANFATITDIRGLVSLNDGEEILKERDPISDNGGLLSIGEFARIIFDDGREITIEGPATITLDENFFQTGEYSIQDVQIQDTQLAQNIAEVAETLYNNNVEQLSTNTDILTEQLNTNLSSPTPIITPETQNIESNNIITTNTILGTEEPITEEPITEEPITEEPITEEPITEEPTDAPTESDVSGANLGIVVNEKTIYTEVEPITKTIIDTQKNSEQGIFEQNGKYYQNQPNHITNSDSIILNNGSSKGSASFNLGGDTKSLTLDVKLTGNENGKGQSQANGKIEFYDNGVKVGETTLINGNSNYSIDKDFDSFTVVHTGTSGKGSSSIHIEGYDTTVTVPTQVEPKTMTIVDTDKMEDIGAIQVGDDWVTVSYEYDVSVNASLIDTDGSESLSNVTLNIGDEKVTIELDETGNGTYSFNSDSQIQNSDISGSVTTTESNGEDTETTFADATDGTDTLVLNMDGEINLDLDNIPDVDVIDMGNNEANTLNLNLGDMLHDTDKLTILGDDTDKVNITSDSDLANESSSTPAENSFDVLSNGNLTIMIQNGLLDDVNDGSNHS